MRAHDRVKTPGPCTCSLLCAVFIVLGLMGCGSGGGDGTTSLMPPRSENSPPKFFASSDVNCDGHFDLIELSTTTQGTNLTRVMLNTGEGRFFDASPQAYPLSDRAREGLVAAAMQGRSSDERSRIQQVVVRDEDGSTKSLFVIK